MGSSIWGGGSVGDLLPERPSEATHVSPTGLIYTAGATLVLPDGGYSDLSLSDLVELESADSGLSTNSIIAIGAASPVRKPVLTMRV